MDIQQNKQLVAKFLDRLGAGDIAGVSELMSDTCTWWISGKPELTPMAGTKNKAEMTKGLEGLLAMMSGPLSMKTLGIIAEGDKVAVEVESLGELKNGRIYNNQYHFLFQVRDGKMISIKEYGDTLHVKAVFLGP